MGVGTPVWDRANVQGGMQAASCASGLVDKVEGQEGAAGGSHNLHPTTQNPAGLLQGKASKPANTVGFAQECRAAAPLGITAPHSGKSPAGALGSRRRRPIRCSPGHMEGTCQGPCCSAGRPSTAEPRGGPAAKPCSGEEQTIPPFSFPSELPRHPFPRQQKKGKRKLSLSIDDKIAHKENPTKMAKMVS